MRDNNPPLTLALVVKSSAPRRIAPTLVTPSWVYADDIADSLDLLLPFIRVYSSSTVAPRNATIVKRLRDEQFSIAVKVSDLIYTRRGALNADGEVISRACLWAQEFMVSNFHHVQCREQSSRSLELTQDPTTTDRSETK